MKIGKILFTGITLAWLTGINYFSYNEAKSEYAENVKPLFSHVSDSANYKIEVENYFANYEKEKRQNIDSLENLVEENLPQKKQKIASECLSFGVKIVDYMARPGREYFLYKTINKNRLRENYDRLTKPFFNRIQ